jgi:molecular chaperone GrpE (heat shock protein)
VHKDEIVTKPFHTESNEIVLRLIYPIDDIRARAEEIERLLKDGRLEDGVEMLLEKMLRFLAEMPVDRYHDYREFRHKGLRSYLIHRFLTEKWRARR